MVLVNLVLLYLHVHVHWVLQIHPEYAVLFHIKSCYYVRKIHPCKVIFLFLFCPLCFEVLCTWRVIWLWFLFCFEDNWSGNVSTDKELEYGFSLAFWFRIGIRIMVEIGVHRQRNCHRSKCHRTNQILHIGPGSILQLIWSIWINSSVDLINLDQFFSWSDQSG